VDGKTVLVAKSGETFNVEFTLDSPLFERIVLPYTQELTKLGIVSTVRTVDSAQYQERVRNFDFDIVVGSFAQSLSPGNEQRDYWGSEAAKRPGSRNILGIENPAIDKLIDRLIFAKSRQELVATCRALDRVLLWNHYVVPMWHIPYERIAYWNRFSKPEKLPDFSVGFPTIWWFDADKDAKIGKS
jgi:microcin C transport system substrate-binding protein